MAISYKVDNVEISALRDRIMFNSFAGNKSYVCKGYGDELAVTSSSSSFVVTLGSGEAVICGGSTFCTGGDTLTLEANQNGYLVLRVDMTQTSENVCKFMNVPELIQGNINNGDEVFDLPLYSYITNTNGVSTLTSVRDVIDDPFNSFKIIKTDTDFNTLIPNKRFTIGYYAVNVTAKTNVNQPFVYNASKIWLVVTMVGYNTNTCYQIAYVQWRDQQNVYIRSCYNGTWTTWGEMLGDRVADDYNIDIRGNYVQYQTSNSSNNSFTQASGVHLYALFSYSANSDSSGYQVAIGTDNTIWFRYYQWWGTTGWQPWKNAIKEYEIGVNNNDSDKRDFIGVKDGVGTFVASSLPKNSINTEQGFRAIKLTSELSSSVVPNDLKITSSWLPQGSPQTYYGNTADIKRAYCRGEVVDWSATSFYRTYAGYVSTNRKTLNLTIPLSRGISRDVTSVTFQNMTVTIGGINGSIITSQNMVGNATYDYTARIDINSDVLYISITKKDGTIFDVPALSPLIVAFYKVKFTFA